jgi:hypothetical protein
MPSSRLIADGRIRGSVINLSKGLVRRRRGSAEGGRPRIRGIRSKLRSGCRSTGTRV